MSQWLKETQKSSKPIHHATLEVRISLGVYNLVMKKFLLVLVLLFPLFTFAQNSNSIADLQNLVKQLQAQIAELQSQIQSLKTELKLTRSLTQGATGEDVKQLQEFLKSIPGIYPEGLVTGYFGPLTKVAIQRFQEKQGIVNSGSSDTTGFGIVGPKTISKINELISSGAGASGVIPQGLAPNVTVLPPPTPITTTATTTTITTPINSGSSGGAGGGSTQTSAPAQSVVTTTNTTTATSSSPSTTPSASTPTTPTDFSMTSSYPGGLDFSWTVSTNNVGFSYKIFLTNTNANTTTVLNQSASSAAGPRSLGEGGFTQGVSYTAYIVTVDSDGNMTEPSPTVSVSTAQLTTPANFQASAVSPTSVSLTWTASQGNVYQYQIRRFTGNLDGAQTSVMVLFPATTYTDTTVQPSTHYIYWIEARDLSGHGASTASATITTPVSSSSGSSTTTSTLTTSQIANVLQALQKILNQIESFSAGVF